MSDSQETAPPAAIPPDDPHRHLTVARPDEDNALTHLGVVGDTYTILLSGADTAGRYTLIDMHVPPGGGPPPHRHDFEEMLTIRPARSATVHLFPVRPGGLLPRGRPARRHPDRGAARARRRRPGRLYREVPGPSPPVPHRTPAAPGAVAAPGRGAVANARPA